MSGGLLAGVVRPPSTSATLVNVAASQAGWFACVLAAAHGRPLIGTAVAAMIVALHAVFAASPRRALIVIAGTLAVGAVLDSVLVASGLVDLPVGKLFPRGTSHWMLALWALFAITLNVSMRWLHGRPVQAAVFGAIGGPLAYHSGVGFGAMVLVDPWRATIAIAVAWAVAMPLLVALAARFDESRA